MAGLQCLDSGSSPCWGPVEMHTTPDRDDDKHFPRCEKHFNERLRQAEQTMKRYPKEQPSDFDPSYAGERWDEDGI